MNIEPRTNYLQSLSKSKQISKTRLQDLQVIENFIKNKENSLDQTQSHISQIRKIRKNISENFDAFSAMCYEIKGREIGNIISKCKTHFSHDGQSKHRYNQTNLNEKVRKIEDYIMSTTNNTLYQEKLKQLIPIIVDGFIQKQNIYGFDREYQFSNYNVSQSHAEHLFVLVQELLENDLGIIGREIFSYYKKKWCNSKNGKIKNENILIRQDPHISYPAIAFIYHRKEQIYKILSDETNTIYKLYHNKLEYLKSKESKEDKIIIKKIEKELENNGIIKFGYKDEHGDVHFIKKSEIQHFTAGSFYGEMEI